MERISDTEVLKFKPGTLEAVRKEVNLDQPGRVDEAIDILENWIKMQPHFTKKDFSRDCLERILISAKGLVERAKERIDKLCTFKTLMPNFFTVSDTVKNELQILQQALSDAYLPDLTPEYYRVYLCKLISEDNFNSENLLNYYKYLVMRNEYIIHFEYCSGSVIVLDMSEVNLMNILPKVNPMEFRQIMTIMTDGYGLRIKGIHVITSSKMVDAVVALLKQVFSEKIGKRIHTHKTIKTVFEVVPKNIMPCEYGGEAKPLKNLQDAWIEKMCSKELLDFFHVMNNAKTNESFRATDKFNENYIGTPGSFRTFNVD